MSLENFRLTAKQRFESTPPENSETFKHKTFFADLDIDISNEDIGSVSFDRAMMKGAIEEGVIVMPIDECHDEVETLLGKNQIYDKFVHMNDAFFNSGILIKVPKGAEIKNGLRLYSETRGNTVYKIILLAEEGSKLNVVKEDFSKDGVNATVSESIDIFLQSGAQVTLSNIQNHGRGITLLSNKTAYCESGSNITWNSANFGAKKVRSRIHNVMSGEGSSAGETEVAFGGDDQMFDMFSTLIHAGRQSSGRVLSKSVMKDRSKSLFKGMIRIEESAKNASSYLAGHGMLLSKSAKAQAIPGLEILTNDVKATHSASVSPIDEEKIFYLESRGLSRDEAVKAISLGFIEPVIARIASEGIRAKIRLLVELKWRGESGKFAEVLEKTEADRSNVSAVGDIFEGHYKYR